MSSQGSKATISTAFRGTTFIQLWRMRSTNEQQAWLTAMHENIHLLQRQPGFLSMSLHPSLDGCNVVVYAQWESDGELQAAVDRPEVKVARVELDKHGEPEGTVFTVDSVYQPSARDGFMQIQPVAERITFVNFWHVAGHQLQQMLLSAMKAEVAEIVGKRGLRAMALHKSSDGIRIVAYAQWDSREAFEEGIARNPSAQKNRKMLAELGEPSANTYRVESVHLPLRGTVDAAVILPGSG